MLARKRIHCREVWHFEWFLYCYLPEALPFVRSIKYFFKIQLLILQPFLGSGEASNCISGKIRFGDETLATVSGHWDQEVFIKDKRSEVPAALLLFVIWCCDSDLIVSQVTQCVFFKFVVSDFMSSFFEFWIHFNDALPSSYCRCNVTRPSRHIGPVLWFISVNWIANKFKMAVHRFGRKIWKLSVFKIFPIESSCITGVNAYISCCDPVHISVHNRIEI